MTRKQKVFRSIRNAAISIAVLLVLFIGAGVAYTWYEGRKPAVNTVVAPTTTTPSTIKHIAPAENVQESASVQSLTSPVMPGDNASITIKTNPGSWCTIKVEYNKVASKDSGLIGKTADDYGTVTWAWTVESTVPLGSWPVTVTCLRNKLSAVVIGSLVVSKTAQTN